MRRFQSRTGNVLCLAAGLGAAMLGRAAAFVSPLAGGQTTVGSLWQHRAAPAAATAAAARQPRSSRVRVSMISNLTNDKTKEKPVVKASTKDRREGTKTDPDRMDSKNFPILEDTSEEDLNVKVTPNAWKWPALWPYTPDYFDRQDDSEDEKAYETPRLASCLEGNARESLVSHYERFLKADSEILEIGASVDSYLPEKMAFSRVVGVGMNPEEMAANNRLTERIVQNLNTQGELPFESDSFDFVVIPNTMEFFTNPRYVMREVYRVLRPEGLCMIPFAGKGAYKDYEKKQIKMWKTMNDAQHMWIMGSFFKFSADAGWDNLKGYDMSPDEGNVLTQFVGNANNIFVVQASKAIPPDASDIGNTIRNRFYGTKSLDTDDVDFTALRLHAMYRRAKTDEEREKVLGLVDAVVDIYDLLGEMPPGVLFAPYKAILATAIAPRWTGSDIQKATLREGLGLIPPGDDFWKPLGDGTQFLHPEDRVRLLVDLLPFFEGSEEAKQALLEVKDVLPEVVAVLKDKVPQWTIPDSQLIATDLIVTDYLPDAREGRASFIEWLKGVDKLQLEVWLEERKNFKARAKDEMETGGLRSAEI